MENYFDFSRALRELKDGKKVARQGWNGEGMFLEVQRPDENSKMGLPYIYISTVQKVLIPWIASQTDLFGEDYYLVD